MGLFSSSKSSNTQQTWNTDRRNVVDGGSVNLSGDGSTLTMLDGGAIAGAFDAFKAVNDSAGEGITAMLGTVERLFAGASAGAAKTQELATQMAGTVEKNVLDAYRNASSDATGTVDNKTIVLVVLGVLAVAGVWAWRAGK